MAAEMAGLGDSEVCADYMYWEDACCPTDGECLPDLLPLTSGVITEVPTDKVSVKSGPHPPCYLCRDGSMPGSNSMVINLLGYGEGSCKQWYYFALEGNVLQHQCDALMCKYSTSIVLYGYSMDSHSLATTILLSPQISPRNPASAARRPPIPDLLPHQLPTPVTTTTTTTPSARHPMNPKKPFDCPTPVVEPVDNSMEADDAPS
jgi:hypothetical protein